MRIPLQAGHFGRNDGGCAKLGEATRAGGSGIWVRGRILDWFRVAMEFKATRRSVFGAYSGERDRSFRPIVTAAHEMVLRG